MADELDATQILERFAKAVDQFLAKTKLAKSGAGEVAVTFELGWFIRDEFYPEWDVHGEYDKRAADPKWADKMLGVVRPDIIVHEVMTQERNLLYIEVKLRGGGNRGYDLAKLAAITTKASGYAYRWGVHLTVDMDVELGVKASDCAVFTSGRPNRELTSWLRERLSMKA